MDACHGQWPRTTGKELMPKLKMWCYRGLLREPWKDKKPNEWVLEKTGSDLMFQNNTASRNLWYFGHICKKQGSIEKEILQGMIVTVEEEAAHQQHGQTTLRSIPVYPW